MRVAQLMEHLAKLDPDADITVLAHYGETEYYREDPQLVVDGPMSTLVGNFDIYGKTAAVKKVASPSRQQLSDMLKVEDFVIWRKE